jgi:hypothetical protein
MSPIAAAFFIHTRALGFVFGDAFPELIESSHHEHRSCASPELLARARPDFTRSMIIARSNSAKTPKI